MRELREDTAGVCPAPPSRGEGDVLRVLPRSPAWGWGTGCLQSWHSLPGEQGESRLMFSEISAFVMEKNLHPPIQWMLCSASDWRSWADTADCQQDMQRAFGWGGEVGVPGQACQARCVVHLTAPSSSSQEINRDKQLQALKPGNCHPFMSRAAFLPSRCWETALRLCTCAGLGARAHVSRTLRGR